MCEIQANMLSAFAFLFESSAPSLLGASSRIQLNSWPNFTHLLHTAPIFSQMCISYVIFNNIHSPNGPWNPFCIPNNNNYRHNTWRLSACFNWTNVSFTKWQNHSLIKFCVFIEIKTTWIIVLNAKNAVLKIIYMENVCH